eukprot:CAMPEP_0197657468 /NCGR_PEP_ID=MMETSP1338-20131121/44645_1 /TAXON_ID=43686 ORGANISM="Pelagodinium beii, Strain RCC1491" /NCGR_SAMPLE_ID=MMETSP1338 /ASSEMBLY_ACC=CAM_ASM_000754 /LENGTH=57 /DNA_ID=CAMNT_0043233841 /DNA_START=67 /DNA_END=237 /DNA_ORIENTATION=+
MASKGAGVTAAGLAALCGGAAFLSAAPSNSGKSLRAPTTLDHAAPAASVQPQSSGVF